jgi:hypothetical protein
MPLGLSVKDVVRLVRDAQSGPGNAEAIAVRGPRAAELAAALTHDGDPTLVTTGGDVSSAGAVVLLLETPPVTGEVDALRRATRAGTPVVAVRLLPFSEAIPYVLAEDVLDPAPDGTLPTRGVAEALARRLPDGGVALGARLPALREAVVRRQSLEASVTAGTLAAFGGSGRPMLPVLALAQTRTMRRLGTASGLQTGSDAAAAAQSTARNLGAALAVGLVGRTLVRRLPARGRLVEGALAAAGTYALAQLANRLARPGDRNNP